jgi:pimeloyl-ACP methyl ester carboxylesterase
VSPFPSHRPRWTIAAAACLSVAALTVLSTGAASATQSSSQATAAKPTVVIEHGAWADASSFASVVQGLQAQGYTVDVPANPLAGLASDTATLADYLKTISGPIVLVGHSYGGMVITDAATGNTQVKALVYVDAYIPAEGESALQLTSARPGSCLGGGGNPANVFNFVTYPGAPANDYDLYVKVAAGPSFPGFAQCFANDLPAAEGAVLAATQSPVTLSALTAPSTAPAWKTIPSWDLVGTRDNVIPPAEQLFMAQRAGAHIVEIAASHLSMISHPRAVERLINQAANAVS